MKDFTPCPKPIAPERGTPRCKAYLAALHQLPCCLRGCKDGPIEAHHTAHGRYAQRKSSDLDAIPLCKRHHQFRTDHSEAWATMYGFDTDYIEATRKAVEMLTGLVIT